MSVVHTKLTDNGCVLIPVEFCKALGLAPGDDVVLSLEDEEIRVCSLDRAIRRAQEIVRRVVPEGVSLADALIAERRAEAERE